MKTSLIAVVCSLALASVSLADSPYKQGEVTVETFATHTYAMQSPGANLHTHDGTWGYGAGVAYFFHRNFGFGGEAVVLDARHPSSTSIDEISLNLTARLPLGESGLAPYVTVGGGRNIENGETHGHVAGGLEYRFQKIPLVDRLSVFAEGRYQWVRTQTDAAQLRGGIRFSF